MATKKVATKTFSIGKRYSVWVTRDVQAVDLDAAVAQLKEAKFQDFLEVAEGAGLNDYETMQGDSIYEDWG